MVLGGVGLGVAIVGGVLVGLAVDASNAVSNAPVGARWSELEDRAANGPIFEGVGTAALGVGLAVVVAGVLWLLLDEGDESSDVAVTANGVELTWEAL